VPLFPFFRYQFAIPDRDNVLFVIQIICIAPKEVKEKFPKSLCIFAPKTPKSLEVVVKTGRLAIGTRFPQVRLLVKGR